MTCVTALASAGTPKFVDVPADDLTDAVELLAKQYEVESYTPAICSGGDRPRVSTARTKPWIGYCFLNRHPLTRALAPTVRKSIDPMIVSFIDGSVEELF